MRGKSWIAIVALTVVAVGVALGWWLYDSYAATGPSGMLAASGRLEGRSVRVASVAGGRITRLAVRKGDNVTLAQVIAELDSREISAAVAGARAALAAAEAGTVAATRRVAALQAQVELSRTEAARYVRLVEHDAAPRQAVDRADAQLKSLEEEIAAAGAARDLAARQAEVAGAELRRAQVRLDETTITAPVAGVVTAELARQGEMVGPGMPVVELLAAEDLKLRVYLPLADAERVSAGTEARVYVDALPGRFFPGTVERVAREAEFTPKDVHMPDERATLVFAVDIRIPNPEGALKDGFPADAYIRVAPNAPWPDRPPW